MKRFLLSLSVFLVAAASFAAAPSKQDFEPLCDSLNLWMGERTSVQTKFSLSRLLRRSGKLDFYFSSTLGEYPWRPEDASWFKSVLKENLPKGYTLGEVFVSRLKLDEHIVPQIGNNGKSVPIRFAHNALNNTPTVTRMDQNVFDKGLYGRHISLWPSHGYYYSEDQNRWIFQRALLHGTVEDLFTPSYVLKYLVPMLENAGANVFLPRERDIQPMEYIIDNDPSFDAPRTGLIRRSGEFSTKGSWQSDPRGFADTCLTYQLGQTPFSMGTSCSIACSEKGGSSASWSANILERGSYAVYVSYVTSLESSSEALYTIHHLGGQSQVRVDQRRGGLTWIYLGNYEFGPDEPALITLSNNGKSGKRVSADAIKIGGGMGKVERAGAVSGLPAWAEGSLYWTQWAGADSTLTKDWEGDYTKDLTSHGEWTKKLKNDKGIPFDLSLAFHTDAGEAAGDTTVGTLAIYTLMAEGRRRNTDGTDRSVSRTLADYVQTQICSDLRSSINPQWNRRGIWNKSYSESRTTDVPGIILELLSHQNFADMRYGLDPEFQFTVSRSVYKACLKFLSSLYNKPYVVQPLPVKNMNIALKDGKAVLSWEQTIDSLEPTAIATGYKVYTRIDDGAFDNGKDFESTRVTFKINPGHIYSYKVVAYNEGGCSFDSEILAVGTPVNPKTDKPVLVLNNFTRLSAAASFDTPQYGGFEYREDHGVPYINEISFIGEVYEKHRGIQWTSDDSPGFGACWDDYAGQTIAGNNFDYVYKHGKALMENGFAFCSTSAGAFENMPTPDAFALDIICGKQIESELFPTRLSQAVSIYAFAGGNVIVSGANIASVTNKAFIQNVLGYKYQSDHASNTGLVQGMQIYNRPNSKCYCVENPDALLPSGANGCTVLSYDGSRKSAAVLSAFATYKVAAYGFPLEVLVSEEDMTREMGRAMDYFLSSEENQTTEQ